jgi:hypothetical protein
MLKIGDKVKWNGENFGISMPVELTTDMVGIIYDIYPEDNYQYEVQFEGLLETFKDGELELA